MAEYTPPSRDWFQTVNAQIDANIKILLHSLKQVYQEIAQAQQETKAPPLPQNLTGPSYVIPLISTYGEAILLDCLFPYAVDPSKEVASRACIAQGMAGIDVPSQEKRKALIQNLWSREPPQSELINALLASGWTLAAS